MRLYSVLIGGAGGQGIIKAGTILGKAAVLEGKYATQFLSYGPEARGTACKSLVKISEEFIESPFAEAVDCLVVLSDAAYRKYSPCLREDGVLIYDPDLVQVEETRHKAYPIRATHIADQLGARIVANIVMLGALSAITGVVKLESLEKIISETFSGKVLEMNLKALKAGWEAVKK